MIVSIKEIFLKVEGKSMTKWTAMFSGITIATLLLTGCSTANEDGVKENPSTSKTENNATQQKQNNAIQQKQTNATTNEDIKKDDETTVTETTTQEQTSEKTNEKTLTYMLNGESKEEMAVLKTSDNQPFSLYVLPQFELSAEEPGKDVLLLKDNDKIFMRIELLPADVDWAATEQNVKEQLSSISTNISDPGLEIGNGLGYEVTSDSEVVTAVLLKDEKAPVRLTMFTTKDADYRNAFLEMAKTIQKQ